MTSPETLDFTTQAILEDKARTNGLYCADLDRLAHKVIQGSVQCMEGDREARNRAFKSLVRAYIAIFALGLIAFAATLFEGLMHDSNNVSTVVFGGLSAASFLSLALFKPLEAIRRNSVFLTWLNVTTTSYWSRHYFLNKQGLLNGELEAATADTLEHLHRLLGTLPEPPEAKPDGLPDPEALLR